MKKGRLIFFKFFLLIILLFVPGINAHSISDTQGYFIETSNNTDNIGSRLTLDIDSSEEEQINKANNSALLVQHECQKIYCKALPLLNILFASVWRPPKVY
jgi:hypothetical protein